MATFQTNADVGVHVGFRVEERNGALRFEMYSADSDLDLAITDPAELDTFIDELKHAKSLWDERRQ